MFDDLRDLYQEVILDHGKSPRNFRRPEDATCLAHGNNPVCGDTLVVYITQDDSGKITDAAFQGQGCAISVASASMMTDIVKGKTVEEANYLFEGFHNMCTRDDFNATELADCDEDAIDLLVMLSGVKEFPIRVKCATLAWHTMQAAVNGDQETSTE